MANTPVFLAGFAAEARIARRSGWPVVTGGGTTAGAAHAVRRLIEAGATGVISFGLAGGLAPGLAAGTLIVAEAVIVDGRRWTASPELNARLGGCTGHVCLGLDRIAATAEEKQSLARRYNADAADMESGVVAVAAANAGIPFAVLRAICDPAWRALPPLALVALDHAGRIQPMRIIRSLLRDPGQAGAVLALARDAAAARRALRSRIAELVSGRFH